MRIWQREAVDLLAARLPGARIEPYGSTVGDGEPDGWSDLDVRIRLARSAPIDAALDAPLWAWQDTVDGDRRRLRLVTADGRRIDAVVEGATFTMPAEPLDGSVRFDAALAAVRLGRGSTLIGLHLLLGIHREALVQAMLRADALTGTSHHRWATPVDERAAAITALLRRPLAPSAARDAYALYGRWRAEVEPDYAPDPTGLDAVIERGG